uniref:Uncharacterized protein n=1 Tax=Oryza punctata TaxID=4537 RepID=A0A0E0LZN2_ORYPU
MAAVLVSRPPSPAWLMIKAWGHRSLLLSKVRDGQRGRPPEQVRRSDASSVEKLQLAGGWARVWPHLQGQG